MQALNSASAYAVGLYGMEMDRSETWRRSNATWREKKKAKLKSPKNFKVLLFSIPFKKKG